MFQLGDKLESIDKKLKIILQKKNVIMKIIFIHFFIDTPR